MIAKFKTYTHDKFGHLYVTTITGKISKLFLSEDYLPNTTDISFTKFYISIGNVDYNLEDVHGNLQIITKHNDDHIIGKSNSNYTFDGTITPIEQIYERLSVIYINENLIIEKE